MNLLSSGVSILAILASLNISDLQAGKRGKPTKEAEQSLKTVILRGKKPPTDEAQSASIIPTTINLLPLSKERDQQFREDFKNEVSDVVALLKRESSSPEELVSAIIALYQKNYHLNEKISSYFNSAIGPIDRTTGKRVDFDASEQEQDIKPDSVATLQIEIEDKIKNMKLPLNKIGTPYLRAILQRLLRDFSIFYIQDFLTKETDLTIDDEIPFQQLDKIRLTAQYNPLCALYGLSVRTVHLELQGVVQSVRENQSTVTTPMEFYTGNRNLEIEKFSLAQGEPWTQRDHLLNFLEEKVKKWLAVTRQYDVDSILRDKQVLKSFGLSLAAKNIGDLFQSAITVPFHNKRDELKLDPSMDTLAEYFSALIRRNYRKASFYHSIRTAMETFVNQQIDEEEVDLQYPSSFILRMGAPAHYFDRPLIDAGYFEPDTQSIREKLDNFVSDFELTLSDRGENNSNVRKLLAKFFDTESLARAPFFKFSGPVKDGSSFRSHFSDAILKFEEDGTPICEFPDQVIVHVHDPETGQKTRTEKPWDQVTQEELKGSFPYFYTRLLIVNLHTMIYRTTDFDDLPLDQVILDTFGEKNKAYYDSLTEEEKQLLLMECAFYMMDKCHRILLDLESYFFNRIDFVPDDVRDNKNFTHTISPLANNLHETPMALVYEVMKGRVMTSELTSVDLRRNWVNLYHNAANFIAPIVKSAQGSTFFRMAYKYTLAAHQIEEYITVLNMSDQLSLYKEKSEKFNAEVEQIKKELDDVLEKSKTHDDQLQKLKKANADITSSLETAKRETDRKKDQLQKSVERERAIQSDLKTVRLAHTQLIQKLEEARQFQTQVQTLENSLKQTEINKKKLEKQISDLETQLNTQSTSLDQQEQKRVTDLTLKQEEIQKVEGQLTQQKSEIEKLQKELSATQKSAEAKVEQLTKEKADLEGEIAKMKTEVTPPATAPQPQFTGIGYLPADLINWSANAKIPEERVYWANILYQTGRRDILSQLRNGLLIPMDQIESETQFQLMKGRELTKANKEFRTKNKALEEENAKLRKQLEDAKALKQ